MRRAALLLATMALGVLAASGVAQAILNGQLDGNGHPYVGALVTEFEVAEGQTELLPVCSGTLISPTVVLTAAHCTDFIEKGENLPTYVTFDSAYEPGRSELIKGTPHTHPLYCLGCTPGLPTSDIYDVGVVVLDERVTMDTYGNLPSEGLVDTLRRGQPFVDVGYGTNEVLVGGGPPTKVSDDARRRANVTLVSTNNSPFSDMLLRISGSSAGRGGEGVCTGDSGGPVLWSDPDDPDQPIIVGNNSYVTNSRCAGVTYAQRMDLPEVLEWVEGFL